MPSSPVGFAHNRFNFGNGLCGDVQDPTNTRLEITPYAATESNIYQPDNQGLLQSREPIGCNTSVNLFQITDSPATEALQFCLQPKQEIP